MIYRILSNTLSYFGFKITYEVILNIFHFTDEEIVGQMH